MANLPARQDSNQFPALLLHTGTAGTADVIRAVADDAGNLMVNIAAGEEINVGTMILGTITLVEGVGTIGGSVGISNIKAGTITKLEGGTLGILAGGSVIVTASTITTILAGTQELLGTTKYVGTIGIVNAGSVIVTSGTTYSGPMAVYLDGTQTSNVTYVGVASVGAAATATVWQLKKIDEGGGTNGDMLITYADGNGSFDNPWTGRGTASYS